MLNKTIKYFLENKLITCLVVLVFITWGITISPFGWKIAGLPSNPVPVDAIPNIGENQQIVFTKWPGQSPQDIEDQISYPLTTYLLGIPGVKSIRSSSVFGFSSIYIIFEENIEFYWSRSRILEKINSLPSGLLPDGIQPTLGPDATALGQIFWYTLEGRDKKGNPTGGWDLHEIRTIQDFYVKYNLNAVEGVSEVASIGGYIQEYQVDVNPSALKAYNIPLHKVMDAVKKSNQEVGAKTIEINQAEYFVRGIGYIRSVEDLEKSVVDVKDNIPIRIKDIGTVSLGPSTRRGILDKGGAEVVGGVVIARYGSNPLQVINRVKNKIKDISSGLPKKTLKDGTESQLTIVPFYDRSNLIQETLGTLEESLTLEILITILVVIAMVYNLRASLLISSLTPITILMVFIAMRYFEIDANIVALSGIVIAIGTIVDLGIILSENIIKHLKTAPEGQKLIDTIYKSTTEVSKAIVTAVSTTIVSFIPVFTMESAEGKLFIPLAFTKTFALISALIVSLLILPTLANWFFGFNIRKQILKNHLHKIFIGVGLTGIVFGYTLLGLFLLLTGSLSICKKNVQKNKLILPKLLHKPLENFEIILTFLGIVWILSEYWLPLGPSKSIIENSLFVMLLIGIILITFTLLEKYYTKILTWCLNHKTKFLTIPVLLILIAVNIWLGFNTVFGFVAKGFDQVGWNIRTTKIWSKLNHTFPGLGKEFMPPLNEGSFLLMPTSMPHSGIDYNRKVLSQLDMLLSNIPEVELAVGKLGRAETSLDPAPISMYETIINYKPEYVLDQKGHRQRFKTDENGLFITNSGTTITNEEGLLKNLGTENLIPYKDGKYYRNWRANIHSPYDIWNEITKVTNIPGITSAPKLQPIETRLVMLQTGMRAPMGIKIYGPNLKTIQSFGMKLESILKNVPSVKSEAVFSDRIVGKPYLHLNINRDRTSRYGLNVADVQQTIETAISGMKITSTVEGRKRFPVRVRYPRELRDDPESLGKILISTPTGAQIPLAQLVDFEYVRGPQVIKSEETFLVGYVLFDKREGYSEISVVNDAKRTINEKIKTGELIVPSGISYKFSGNYENQVRAEKKLAIIVPLVLIIVFLILYFQFKSVSTSSIVFTGIFLAFSGGFIMVWLWGESWFINFSLFGTNLRDLFQMHTINLSVAVWVGFIALFGIATDDGVLMCTYLDESMKANRPKTLSNLRLAVVKGGQRRIKPTAMTTATTVIALLPVLSSTGRGADIMIPMAIPIFGGMIIDITSYFIAPVLYCMREERKLKKQLS